MFTTLPVTLAIKVYEKQAETCTKAGCERSIKEGKESKGMIEYAVMSDRKVFFNSYTKRYAIY
jgi:hypothetical protein